MDIATALGLSLFLTALGACTKPVPKGLDSYDPTGRIGAMLDVAAKNDTSKIPQLIGALDSDDSAVRLTAIRTLERMTGQTLGYDHAAPERERRAATDRWVEWYQGRTADGSMPSEARREGL